MDDLLKTGVFLLILITLGLVNLEFLNINFPELEKKWFYLIGIISGAIGYQVIVSVNRYFEEQDSQKNI